MLNSALSPTANDLTSHSSCKMIGVFDIIGEMELGELAFSVLVPAAVLLTGFLCLLLITRL
jgi:hypothetical protein